MKRMIAAITSTPATRSFACPSAYIAPITRRISMSTSGSHRKSGRVATRTRSAGSRMRSPGASPRLSRSDIAGILGGERSRRRGLVRRAGRGRNEQVQEPQRFGARGDAVQQVQGATAVRLDLALEHRAYALVVEDRADPLHVLRRQRRLRREELIELRPNTRRRPLEREHHREGL